MKKILACLIILVALWWLNPFTSNRLKSDVPHKLLYKERVFGASSGDRLPMLIVLHGAGGDEKDLLFMMKKIKAPFRYIGFRGPESSGRGYVWARALGKSRKEANAAYAEAVNDVAFSISEGIKELRDRYSTAGKPVVLGFSMGAEMVYFLAGTYPENFSAAFAVAGNLNRGLDEFFEGGAGLPVFAYHGKSDRLVPRHGGKRAATALAELGRDVTFEEFDGGHTIPQLVLDDLGQYLKTLN